MMTMVKNILTVSNLELFLMVEWNLDRDIMIRQNHFVHTVWSMYWAAMCYYEVYQQKVSSPLFQLTALPLHPVTTVPLTSVQIWVSTSSISLILDPRPIPPSASYHCLPKHWNNLNTPVVPINNKMCILHMNYCTPITSLSSSSCLPPIPLLWWYIYPQKHHMYHHQHQYSQRPSPAPHNLNPLEQIQRLSKMNHPHYIIRPHWNIHPHITPHPPYIPNAPGIPQHPHDQKGSRKHHGEEDIPRTPLLICNRHIPTWIQKGRGYSRDYKPCK